MPLKLKNDGATYQRMVNKMSKNVLGKNMEVYVDDMLVKSKTFESHHKDLEEAFAIIWEYEMKLNPKKIKSLLNMPSPKKHKDVQKLIGRIAAVTRFVSKSRDKCIKEITNLNGQQNVKQHFSN
uniref:Reverse transcriptase domain-containing protein n=1 Tax=Cannabis sativa TaxID=3483 RepID=A0A803NI83_CANSA